MKRLGVLLLFTVLFLISANHTFALPQQGADSVTVQVTTYFDSDNTTGPVSVSATYGAALAFDGDLDEETTGYTFAFWLLNGTIRKDLPIDHQFIVTDNMSLTGVFKPDTTSPETFYLLFIDTNGEELGIQYVTDGNDGTDITEGLPTKPGYTISSTPKWSDDYTGVNEDRILILRYDKSTSDTYTLTVDGGTTDDGSGSSTSGTYDYNEVATVVADTPAGGEYFHHWEINDRTVSYQSTYSFTVLESVTITAVYATSAPSDSPHVGLSYNLSLRSGYKSYLGQFYLPSGYTLVEYGVLSSTSQADLYIDTAGVQRNQGMKYLGTTNEFVLSIAEANAVSVKPYLIAKDGSNNLVTVYGQASYNLYNGGFETGDLTGWNAYTLWKDESGMAAFIDDRVVSGTYFGGGYPYDREGTYNIGVEGGSLTWDQSSERMGHLRSADFTLGGSGWISFKLGGGRTPDFAYVSVRKTEDHTEVARFANRHYNDTTKATAQYGSTITNAEAFMFQYYFDLGSLADVSLGDSLYFVLTEAAAYDWAILSADAFVTYYKTAPSTTTDTLAENIVPSINGAGSATNSIPNGDFSSGLTSWDDVQGGWYDNSGIAQSNESGDGDLGVLRSSAFTINGSNIYLEFDWGGGLKWDKQIFVSVKEVGTNIEVLRFVRRDNLSGKENTNLDNHMMDISGLDSSKEYYLEFADNRTSSWGLSIIDNVELVDQTRWDAVTSGDRGVSISGIPTNFAYVKPE
mgnify:CR=1 FL=1